MTSEQAAANKTIAIDSARPLADAILAIERRHGWAITYEDPRYEHKDEVADVTANVRRSGSSSERVLIPRAGQFQFTYELVPKDHSDEVADEVVNQLVREYGSSGNPGRFRVDRGQGMLHVIPTVVRLKDGAIERRTSILDTTVVLPAGEPNTYEVVQQVLRRVGDSTGRRILFGSGPLNLLLHTNVRQDGAATAARVLLERALVSAGRKLSWQMLYDPGLALYVFNVHLVQQ